MKSRKLLENPLDCYNGGVKCKCANVSIENVALVSLLQLTMDEPFRILIAAGKTYFVLRELVKLTNSVEGYFNIPNTNFDIGISRSQKFNEQRISLTSASGTRTIQFGLRLAY